MLSPSPTECLVCGLSITCQNEWVTLLVSQLPHHMLVDGDASSLIIRPRLLNTTACSRSQVDHSFLLISELLRRFFFDSVVLQLRGLMATTGGKRGLASHAWACRGGGGGSLK